MSGKRKKPIMKRRKRKAGGSRIKSPRSKPKKYK